MQRAFAVLRSAMWKNKKKLIPLTGLLLVLTSKERKQKIVGTLGKNTSQ